MFRAVTFRYMQYAYSNRYLRMAETFRTICTQEFSQTPTNKLTLLNANVRLQPQ